MTKKCCRCDIIKDFSEFYPRKGKPGGLNYHCKDCAKKEANEVHRKNGKVFNYNRFKKWKGNNKNSYLANQRKRAKYNVDNLTDSYVKQTLAQCSDLKTKDIPDDLIKLQRNNLKLKRILRDESKML